MAVMAHAKFRFNQLMVSLIFVIRACDPPGPCESGRLKRPGLIGLSDLLVTLASKTDDGWFISSKIWA